MNIASVDYNRITSNNVESLFKEYDIYYKSITIVQSLRKSIATLSEAFDNTKECVFYAKVFNNKLKIEEVFTLSVNHQFKLTLKIVSEKTATENSIRVRNHTSINIINNFLADVEKYAILETEEQLKRFFHGIMSNIRSDFISEMDYGDGELGMIVSSKTLNQHFEIYFKFI